ncbi:MAG TPA: serine/threonine-protein kinase [Kofleriaceae bacterium]
MSTAPNSTVAVAAAATRTPENTSKIKSQRRIGEVLRLTRNALQQAGRGTIAPMTDDGNAPTIPDTAAPTHAARVSHAPARTPVSPDPRYALRTLLGSGGMGEVWLAHDVRIDRDIAIKMMRGNPDEDAVARFLREARVQGRLEHPAIVPVHDLGPDEKAPFFAMKRLSGRTLHDVIGAHDPEWTRQKLLARFIDICFAVEFAHKRGVIHRDLKPANIMLGEFGETYVLDWGLARIADEAEPPTPTRAIRTRDLRSDSGSGGQTQAGALLGTPGYMSPEQMRGEPVDPRTDVFALGCILFELLAGVAAIPRDRAFEVTFATAEYRPAARCPDRDIPPELDELCARATAQDRDARIATARELADAVQRYLEGDRDLERRKQLAAQHAGKAALALVRALSPSASNEAARAEAMREAARAIALDPRNSDAQSILGRLLVDVPTPIPEPARRSLEADDNATVRQVLVRASWAYLANFVLLIAAILIGIRGTWPLVLLGVFTLLQAGFCQIASRREDPLSPLYMALILTGHFTLLMLVGTIAGSLLFLPIFAFGSLPIMLMLPRFNHPIGTLSFHIIAVAIPVILDQTGIIPSSFHTDAAGIHIKPWAVDASPRMVVLLLYLVIFAQMFVTTRVFMAQRRAQLAAQEHLHAQRWQLAQLVE